MSKSQKKQHQQQNTPKQNIDEILHDYKQSPKNQNQGWILVEIGKELLEGYNKQTEHRVKVIDAYIIFCSMLVLVQMVYVVLAGKFPMNSLIAGIGCPLGAMIITVCLRLQLDKETRYLQIKESRVIWEYLICMLILFTGTINYIG